MPWQIGTNLYQPWEYAKTVQKIQGVINIIAMLYWFSSNPQSNLQAKECTHSFRYGRWPIRNQRGTVTVSFCLLKLCNLDPKYISILNRHSQKIKNSNAWFLDPSGPYISFHFDMSLLSILSEHSVRESDWKEIRHKKQTFLLYQNGTLQTGMGILFTVKYI